MRHSPAESVVCKLHAARREINRHCSRRLRLRRVAPSRRNSSAAAAHAFGNSYKAAYYIPSTLTIVDFGAVRQSIREREDAYPVDQDYADLLPRAVLLFLTWQGSFATRSGANQLMTL